MGVLNRIKSLLECSIGATFKLEFEKVVVAGSTVKDFMKPLEGFKVSADDKKRDTNQGLLWPFLVEYTKKYRKELEDGGTFLFCYDFIAYLIMKVNTSIIFHSIQEYVFCFRK